MIWRWPSQNTFRMCTVQYWTRSSRTQFGVSINVWRLAGDTLNITCNFLYCNHLVHRDFLITLYKTFDIYKIQLLTSLLTYGSIYVNMYCGPRPNADGVPMWRLVLQKAGNSCILSIYTLVLGAECTDSTYVWFILLWMVLSLERTSWWWICHPETCRSEVTVLLYTGSPCIWCINP